MPKFAPVVLLLGACWVDNAEYRSPDLQEAGDALPDAVRAPPADLSACPPQAPGGGTGMGRQEMLVPGGPYRIGGTTYTAAGFYLDVYLVTVAAYRQCVSAGACGAPAMDSLCNFSEGVGSREDHPVNCVTQAQAQAFCQWAGRRLPGEGEWQYVAAGAKMSTYPWGDDSPHMGPGAQLCWGQSAAADLGSAASTCPVGTFARTFLGTGSCTGVADLAGDLREWLGSEYHDPYVFPETSCTAASLACSVRGGAWSDFAAVAFQSATRNTDSPIRRPQRLRLPLREEQVTCEQG